MIIQHVEIHASCSQSMTWNPAGCRCCRIWQGFELNRCRVKDGSAVSAVYSNRIISICKTVDPNKTMQLLTLFHFVVMVKIKQQKYSDKQIPTQYTCFV